MDSERNLLLKDRKSKAISHNNIILFLVFFSLSIAIVVGIFFIISKKNSNIDKENKKKQIALIEEISQIKIELIKSGHGISEFLYVNDAVDNNIELELKLIKLETQLLIENIKIK